MNIRVRPSRYCSVSHARCFRFLVQQVAELSEINSSNLRYMEQMEEYTNGVEAANADLKRQVG